MNYIFVIINEKNAQKEKVVNNILIIVLSMQRWRIHDKKTSYYNRYFNDNFYANKYKELYYILFLN